MMLLNRDKDFDAIAAYHAWDLVVDELIRATKKSGEFPTPEHALAVIEEEVDEFKHEIRHGTLARQRAEAVQVAAMAIRFLMDCE